MQVLIVDAANVIGSSPDGWWRDRAGAARRLHDQLSATAVVARRRSGGPSLCRTGIDELLGPLSDHGDAG
ncbi:MAG: hypothetical protein WA892_00115 [Ornithinimicrobium sp.]